MSNHFARLALALLLLTAPEITLAQSSGEKTSVQFSLVRSFSLPSLPAENLQSELFRKTQGDVVLADVIDLNLKFSAEHGTPEAMPPQFAPKTHTVILRFPDGWWTTTMVRSDGKGSFICRVKMRFFEPKPNPDDFGKYVDWCHGSLTLATLDPDLLSGAAQP